MGDGNDFEKLTERETEEEQPTTGISPLLFSLAMFNLTDSAPHRVLMFYRFSGNSFYF